jgi:hypothetical protein
LLLVLPLTGCYALNFCQKGLTMKALLYICMIFSTTFVWAGEIPAPPALVVVKGEVLEARNVANYTYLHLKTGDGETWAAVNKTPVTKGSNVTIEKAMVMHDFTSPSLKKTFKTIYFGNLAGLQGDGMAKTSGTTETIHVPRAIGENACTVEEVMTRGAELKDKSVLVSGKVVKYNTNIMGKNWIHLRDGSGSAENGDVLVTTTDQAKVGDVVTVKGVVRTDRDFGAGYSYKVLIEEATLQIDR